MAGIGVVVLAVASCAYVGVVGSVVVHDDSGDVIGAVVTNDRREQALMPLPGGLFVAISDIEGIVEVRCRNGARARAGYVTVYTHVSIRVSGDVPCRRVVEER